MLQFQDLAKCIFLCSSRYENVGDHKIKYKARDFLDTVTDLIKALQTKAQ
jgi:exopolysaccharide biosynthesis predicted pyruvyltransferase EpsI